MSAAQNQIQHAQVGDWVIRPNLGRIERAGELRHIESRAMAILLYFVDHHGKVISIQELAEKVWGHRYVRDNTVYQWVHILRKALGDDPHRPQYIVTIQKNGYRLIAEVSTTNSSLTTRQEPGNRNKNPPVQLLAAGLALVVSIALAVIYLAVFAGIQK